MYLQNKKEGTESCTVFSLTSTKSSSWWNVLRSGFDVFFCLPCMKLETACRVKPRCLFRSTIAWPGETLCCANITVLRTWISTYAQSITGQVTVRHIPVLKPGLCFLENCLVMTPFKIVIHTLYFHTDPSDLDSNHLFPVVVS